MQDFVKEHSAWLKGDRMPRFFGESFVVLYDSNTAREFVKKCRDAAEKNSITLFQMERPVQ
jgi:hypothetical protein